MSLAAALRRRPVHVRSSNRWLQIVASVVGMMAIAGVLFVWPLLRSGPGDGFAQSLAAAQNAFAFFILAETLFVPIEAWLGDRSHPLLLAALGVALVVLGGFAGAAASGRAQIVWSAVGGVGAGLAYGGTVAKALKRFTDRKALCVGVTAGACFAVLALAFGAVAAVSSPSAIPLLVVLGAGQAAVILLATLLILYPPPDRPPPDW
jgi:OFA family oxalate/formate antiporter-like MFS transporter